MKNQNAASNQAPAAQPEPHPGEVFCHLNRIMSNRSKGEQQFFRELVEGCAKTPLELPEEVLYHASKALNLGVRAEGVEQFAVRYRDFSRLMQEDGWLWEFVESLLHGSRTGKLWPADVALMLSTEIEQFDGDLGTAQRLLKESPELIAEDIRKAVAAKPELLRA